MYGISKAASQVSNEAISTLIKQAVGPHTMVGMLKDKLEEAKQNAKDLVSGSGVPKGVKSVGSAIAHPVQTAHDLMAGLPGGKPDLAAGAPAASGHEKALEALHAKDVAIEGSRQKAISDAASKASRDKLEGLQFHAPEGIDVDKTVAGVEESAAAHAKDKDLVGAMLPGRHFPHVSDVQNYMSTHHMPGMADVSKFTAEHPVAAPLLAAGGVGLAGAGIVRSLMHGKKKESK